MKILFLEWADYGAQNWIDEFRNQGHQVIHGKVPAIVEDDDIKFQSEVLNLIQKEGCDVLCTFNFFPVLSVIALRAECKYIAWVYDSPLIHLYSPAIGNPCNYVFLFDKKQYQEFYQRGIRTVYYLPLAGITGIEEISIEYSSDVTFVGSLYQNYNLYDEIKYLPDKLRGYLEGIMEAQRKIYGYYMLPDLLTEDIIEETKKYVKLELENLPWIEYKEIFCALFLTKKIANIERESMLLHLAEYFTVSLYSNERLEHDNIINCGKVQYGIDMYKLFQKSKININSTLRCIQTGINLRVMDILSAGGFCLTNYQEELNEHFEIGKELVVYESELDLMEKTAYYLEHEDLRKEIAWNGKKRIEKSHTYAKRIKDMLDIVTNKDYKLEI